MIELYGLTKDGRASISVKYHPETKEGVRTKEWFESICKRTGLICINHTELLKFAAKIMQS